MTISARRWQLWIEYLLAKADHDEAAAARKLGELMETLT
jgi:hypothetical protein